MPTYDYKCKECNENFEVLCKIAEMSLPRECKHCGSLNTERFIGGAPGLGDSFAMGLVKPGDGWKEVLQKIDSTPGSVLKDNSRFL